MIGGPNDVVVETNFKSPAPQQIAKTEAEVAPKIEPTLPFTALVSAPTEPEKNVDPELQNRLATMRKGDAPTAPLISTEMLSAAQGASMPEKEKARLENELREMLGR